MARILAALAMCVSLAAAPAFAQNQQQEHLQQRLEEMRNAPSDPSLPAVNALTCDQMMAEMMSAGSAERPDGSRSCIAGLRDETQGRGVGPNAPRPTEAQAAANRERMAGLGNQVMDSTQGIDMNRMMAVSDRFQSEHCPTPQGPQPH
ncbi:MAG: hypothetical protein IPL62_16900 [Caulobacteraceae bacterium]|nr:hypothetical protein [Caulobacteraceae bacterium]